MKKLGLIMASMAMLGMGASAHAAGSNAKGRPAVKPAAVYNPLLKCDSIEFRIRGGGLQPVIGVFKLTGDGYVSRRTGKEYVGRYHCTDLDANKRVDVLAKVTMGSDRGIAPRVSVGYFEIEAKADVKFVGRAADLEREFVTGGAKIAWGLGLGLQTMVIEDGEHRIALKLKPLVGAGIDAGFSTVAITPMRFAEPKQLTDID